MLKRFLADRDGSIVIIAAFVTPVLLFMTAFAIEYGVIMHRKQQLQSAVNTSALSAANEVILAYKGLEDIDFEAEMLAIAKASYEAATANIQGVVFGDITVTPEIDGGYVALDIRGPATFETMMLKIAGYDTLSFDVNTSVVVSTSPFLNFNFLFDASASMGVGATVEDQRKSVEATNCAFGCHFGNSPTTYDQARGNGANMRIDVSREAAIDTIDILEENLALEDQFSIGVHTFHSYVQTHASGTDPNATNLSRARSVLRGQVQLSKSGGGSSLEHALSEMAQDLPRGGSGRNVDDRRQILIVMTDGVEHNFQDWSINHRNTINQPSFGGGHHIIYALSEAACDDLKEKNIEVYFIYSEYITPTLGRHANHSHFNFIKNTLHDILPDRFAACAGNANRVFNVRTPEEIRDAFSQLVSSLSTPLHMN